MKKAKQVTVVVMGQSTNVQLRARDTVQQVARRALDATGSIGQPLRAWEMRDVDGVPLDGARKASDFAGVMLFLNPRAGVGGASIAA